MNIQHTPDSKQWVPDTSEDDVARKYLKNRLRRSQDTCNLPRYIWPEYGSILKTLERFSLITHLIFLFKRKKFSKKEYIRLSLLWNANILEELRRKWLLSEIDT